MYFEWAPFWLNQAFLPVGAISPAAMAAGSCWSCSLRSFGWSFKAAERFGARSHAECANEVWVMMKWVAGFPTRRSNRMQDFCANTENRVGLLSRHIQNNWILLRSLPISAQTVQRSARAAILILLSMLVCRGALAMDRTSGGWGRLFTLSVVASCLSLAGDVAFAQSALRGTDAASRSGMLPLADADYPPAVATMSPQLFGSDGGELQPGCTSCGDSGCAGSGHGRTDWWPAGVELTFLHPRLNSKRAFTNESEENRDL